MNNQILIAIVSAVLSALLTAIGAGVGVYVALSNQITAHSEQLRYYAERMQRLEVAHEETNKELRAVNLSLVGWVQRHQQLESRQP